jgi:hypothetical protein
MLCKWFMERIQFQSDTHDEVKDNLDSLMPEQRGSFYELEIFVALANHRTSLRTSNQHDLTIPK